MTDPGTTASVQIVLAFLNVVQTIALAVIAARSRRVRRTDRPRSPSTDRRN